MAEREDVAPASAGRRRLIERAVMAVAAIAVLAFVVQQYTGRRQEARLESMRTALQRLALAQESWRYDRGVYAADLQALVARGYQPPPAVRIVINEATVRGWSATATHDETLVGCFLYVGDAAPVGLANRMGAVRCG